MPSDKKKISPVRLLSDYGLLYGTWLTKGVQNKKTWRSCCSLDAALFTRLVDFSRSSFCCKSRLRQLQDTKVCYADSNTEVNVVPCKEYKKASSEYNALKYCSILVIHSCMLPSWMYWTREHLVLKFRSSYIFVEGWEDVLFLWCVGVGTDRNTCKRNGGVYT